MAKRNRSSSNNSKNIFTLEGLSFVAILLIGLALLAAYVLAKVNTDLANAARVIERIGLAIALIVPVFLSYRWARRSKMWVFVLWIIAVVVVVVFYILAFI